MFQADLQIQMKQEQVQGQKPPPSQEGQLFHIAFSQRRKMNLEQLRQHMVARSSSVKQRSRIYRTLQLLFRQKIEYTKQFIKDFIRYFEDTLSLYSGFYKSISKLELHKKPKEFFVYEAFERAALELTELNTGEVQNLKVLTTWIEKILIPALNAVYEMYKDWTKDARKEMENFDEEFDSARSKDIKFYDRLTDNNDLLENEIILVDKLELSDGLLVKWGRHIYTAWIDLLKKEGEIRQQLQKNIIEFHDKFTRVYNESQSSKNLLKFWMEMESPPTWFATFASVLNEKDAQFISFGCKTSQLRATYQPFIDLTYEKDRISDPFKLIEILQNKRFKCKLQRSQREYVNIRIYFTVDANVLLFDEAKKKVALKLKEEGFKAQRLSQNLIEVSGMQIGVLFDSKCRQKIHFGTMDEAEQFVFFVQNLMHESMVIRSQGSK